ncbi:MAG: ribosome maturation factor RimM [Pseudomonadota bacterium]
MASSPDKMTCVGAIMGAHGVRGLVKVKAFLEDPARFTALDHIHFGAQGEAVPIVSASRHKDNVLIVQLDGVDSRETAQALKSTQLFVPRDWLVDDEEEDILLSDLEGLRVLDEAHGVIGTVSQVSNFGASDVLEIALEESGKTVMVPFIEAAVPEVDLAAGHIIIDPVYIA